MYLRPHRGDERRRIEQVDDRGALYARRARLRRPAFNRAQQLYSTRGARRRRGLDGSPSPARSFAETRRRAGRVTFSLRASSVPAPQPTPAPSGARCCRSASCRAPIAAEPGTTRASQDGALLCAHRAPARGVSNGLERVLEIVPAPDAVHRR